MQMRNKRMWKENDNRGIFCNNFSNWSNRDRRRCSKVVSKIVKPDITIFMEITTTITMTKAKNWTKTGIIILGPLDFCQDSFLARQRHQMESLIKHS